MQCNIDQRGRAARILTGAIIEAIGLGLVGAWFMDALPRWALLVGIGTIAAGNFSIFEGISGWCIVRAMGFKTPM